MSAASSASAAPDAAAPVARGPVLRRLAITLLGILIGLAAADVAIGRYDSSKDLSDEGMLEWDPALSWTNRPGFRNERTTISSLGLRSPEIPADAPRDEVRILGVGASRTFGAGEGGPNMYETWSHYLEELADREFDGPWRVLNGGVMGYSMRQSVRRAKQMLDAIEPDLVLVFVSPGAQLLLDPSAARHMRQLPSGRLIPRDLEDVVPGPLLEPVAAAHGFLLETSAIYSRYRAQFNDKGAETANFHKFVLSSAERPPHIDAMYRESLDELTTMTRLCTERRIEVRAVVLIEPFQDSDERWAEYLARNASLGAPPKGTARTESTEILLSELARRGVEAWDMTQIITLFGTNLPHYTCDNAHWSAVGHRAIAFDLLRKLHRDGLDRALVEARRANPR